MQFRLSVAGEEKKNLSDDNGQSVRVIIGNVRKSSNDPRHRQTSFWSSIEYPIIKIFQPTISLMAYPALLLYDDAFVFYLPKSCFNSYP